MKKVDFPKLLFIFATVGFAFVYGVIVATYKVFPYEILSYLKDSVFLVYEERHTLAKTKPEHFLQPARYDGNGVTVNDVPKAREELVLLSGFFETSNELRLIQRDGTVVARWPVSFSDIFTDTDHTERPPATDWNIDTHGALILPDGSVIFNFEYGGLVRLDRCGALVWKLSRETHHSVERAEDGGFWVPGRRFYPSGSDSPFPPFEPPFYEDTLLRVSEDGQVLAEISVPGLFFENGLESLLTASGHPFHTDMKWDNEIVHLNKIGELPSDIATDFPMLESGDLVLSIREMNMVMVVNPDTRDIKWWRIGPWVRQHDPEFKAGGKIVVFNNNNYWGLEEELHNNASPYFDRRASNIIEIELETGRHEIIYGDKEDQEFLSIIRGKLQLTREGGLLVTEFQGGRVFETGANGKIVWEYINRYSSDEVAEVPEARIYPENYFNVSNWDCE